MDKKVKNAMLKAMEIIAAKVVRQSLCSYIINN